MGGPKRDFEWKKKKLGPLQSNQQEGEKGWATSTVMIGFGPRGRTRKISTWYTNFRWPQGKKGGAVLLKNPSLRRNGNTRGEKIKKH